MRCYIYSIPVLVLSAVLLCETLFEIKDSSNQTVFNISEDGLRVFNHGDTLMVISATEIKAVIDNSKALSRKFSVSTTSSKGDNDVFKVSSGTSADVVDKNTMLWYPQKNAFRVGKVLIQDADDVGENSFATGFNSQASGDYSQALGNNCNAKGDNSTAIGYGSRSDDLNCFSVGYNSISKKNSSYAFGYTAKAMGYSCYALGHGAVAGDSLINPYDSYAWGKDAWATKGGAYAIGFNAKATAGDAYAFGQSARAFSQRSYAIGEGALTEGSSSYTFGKGTYAGAAYTVALGFYNESDGDSLIWVDTDPLFVIGNGTGVTTRSNALVVKKNGETYIPSLYDVTSSNTKKALFVDSEGKLCVDADKFSENDYESENQKLREEIEFLKKELEQIKNLLNINNGSKE